MHEHASRWVGWITEPGLFKSPAFAFTGLFTSWVSAENILKGACLVMTTIIIGIQCYNQLRKQFRSKPPKHTTTHG